jgi:hypothetical protein
VTGGKDDAWDVVSPAAEGFLSMEQLKEVVDIEPDKRGRFTLVCAAPSPLKWV